MQVRALRGVDLRIQSGELTLIEGPSGSGKTTLLHIVAMLQRADQGEVWFDGRRVDRLPESRLPAERRAHVVLIFQVYNLLESLTAADNVALAGLLTKGSRRAVPVEDYLQRVNLQQRADHLPAELSGGERQRTAIARALACPGRLVLADEPTANLDWENAREVMQSLADLARRESRAVVVVSHDSRLEPFADRIVSLLDGQIAGDRRRRERPMSGVPNNPDPMPRTGRRRRGRVVVATVLGIAVLLAIGGLLAVRHLGGDTPVGHRLKTGATPAVPAESEAGRYGLSAASRPTAVRPCVAAAPAVVEPTTQLVEIRTERQGRIKAVLKRAGERISQGEPLVLLDDAPARALVEQRRADLMLTEASLAQLKAWDRPEERAKAKAGVERARARLDRAERDLQRTRSLYERAVAPETELSLAIEEQRLAAAALEEARQIAAMTEAGPTPEEVRVAEARVEQARAVLRWAQTELALRTIVSPLDGHVIYRHLEPGEVVDPESPVPILSVGKLDEVRLRAEVDEADIRRVKVGQRVVATAEAFGDRQITGRVVHLEPMMGRKTIRTQRTTEQQDTKVREVLIELDPDTPPLPIDFQMTVRFLAASHAPTTTTSPASSSSTGQ